MQKIISFILLAALLIGMLAFSACQPPQEKTETELESAAPESGSDQPASDTELISTEADTLSTTQAQN